MIRCPLRFFALPVAGLFLFSAMPAYAEDTVAAFHPSKAWSAGPTAKISEYGGECVLQNEFNNGFILQFKGSSNWVQSLDVNFRQSVFEAGKSYQASLSVPGHTEATLSAKAISGNVLSITLKGHKELFKEARTNAVLDANIEGNNFRFYLTGFTDAAKNFERCMAGGSALAAEKTDGMAGVGVAPPQVNNAHTANEAAAFEATEKQVAAVIAEPVAQDIPYTKDHEIIEYSPVPTARTRAPQKRPEILPHKKLSAQLAQEISTNPELINGDHDAMITQTLSNSGRIGDDADEGLAMPPSFTKEAPIPKDIITPAPSPKTAAVVEPVEVEPVREVVVKRPEPIMPTPIQEATVKVEEKLVVEPVVEKNTAPAPKRKYRIIQSEPILSDAVLIDDLNAPLQAKGMAAPVVAEEVVSGVGVAPPKDVEVVVSQPKAQSTLLPLAGEELAIKDTEIAEVPAVEVEQEIAPPKTVSPKTGDMKVTREHYSGTADFSDNIASSSQDIAAYARLTTMEKELELMRAENQALNDELGTALREGEQERLTISSENWNLERATMRYNEAERQIKRLGQQLQKERAQNALEKKELEMMLFDPELTDQAQLARLSQLEQELEAARAALAGANGQALP